MIIHDVSDILDSCAGSICFASEKTVFKKLGFEFAIDSESLIYSVRVCRYQSISVYRKSARYIKIAINRKTMCHTFSSRIILVGGFSLTELVDIVTILMFTLMSVLIDNAILAVELVIPSTFYVSVRFLEPGINVYLSVDLFLDLFVFNRAFVTSAEFVVTLLYYLQRCVPLVQVGGDWRR